MWSVLRSQRHERLVGIEVVELLTQVASDRVGVGDAGWPDWWSGSFGGLLAGCARVLGSDHLDTLTSGDNPAGFYW